MVPHLAHVTVTEIGLIVFSDYVLVLADDKNQAEQKIDEHMSYRFIEPHVLIEFKETIL